jgi:MFS transporter, Spinster family, sphingosine-1-phosphate transporter
MQNSGRSPSGARSALLLLLAINLFNYIDRQILAAVEPEIRATFFAATDVNAMAKTGALGMVFLITYMLAAPALGWLADRFSRWSVVGVAVLFWSLATGATGLAASFSMLVTFRVLVGVGEGGYGPAAPTILADWFPLERRARIMAYFCAAIPVGSALGYVLGGAVTPHLGWRAAFYILTIPGLLLGLVCFFQRDPRGLGAGAKVRQRAHREDYRKLLRTRSYGFNMVAQTAMTFAAGGMGFWIAEYLHSRGQPPEARIIFGGIVVVAGLVSTVLGGWLADRLRNRYAASDFLVSAIGMLVAFPIFIVMLFTPFPLAWVLMFAVVFLLFLNTGPSNAAIANVSFSNMRERAFGLNILIIHLFGDVAAYPIIGYVGGHTNMTVAFFVVSVMILLSGVAWLGGMKYLPGDTAAVENTTAPA